MNQPYFTPSVSAVNVIRKISCFKIKQKFYAAEEVVSFTTNVAAVPAAACVMFLWLFLHRQKPALNSTSCYFLYGAYDEGLEDAFYTIPGFM